MSIERALNVHVNITSNIAGAKAAASSLQDVKESAAGAGRAEDGLGDSQDNLTKKIDKTHASSRGLRAIFGILGRETIPELGTAFDGALYGPIGLVLALAAGLEYLKKELDGVKDAEDKSANQSFLPGLEARHAAIVKLHHDMADYLFDLAHTTTAETIYKDALKTEVDLLKEKADALERIHAAQTAAAQAQVAARTDLTEQEKTIMAAIISRGAANATTSSQSQLQNEIIATAQKELEKRAHDKTTLDAAAQAAITKAGYSAADRDQAQADLPGLKEQMQKLLDLEKSQGDIAKKAYDDEARERKIYEDGPKGFVGADADKNRTRNIAEGQRNIMGRIANAIKEVQTGIDNFTKKAEVANTDAAAQKAAVARSDENKAALEAKEREVAELNAKKVINDNANPQVAAANDSANAAVTAVRLAAQAQAHAQTATQAQIEALNTIIDLALKQHENVAYIQSQLKVLASGLLNQKGVAETIQRILDALAAGQRGSTQNTPGP